MVAATKNAKKKKNHIRESFCDNVLKVIVYTLVTLLSLTCVLPILNILACSFSGVDALNAGKVTFWPVDWNIEAYETIITNGSLIRSMNFSLLVTGTHILITLVMTVLCAYPLSHSGLVGKSVIWPFILFTMYFSGGMIPSYLLVRDLGLLNTMWCLILPGAISTYNMILMRSFFSSIPEALREAALVDGANDATTLVRIILPLSKSMLATIALFYAVARWNGVQDGMIYINDPNKYILQVRLKNIILSSASLNELMAEGAANQIQLQTQQIRSASLVFSMIPVLVVYPFLQKYFVKGVMIGSVKG